MTDSIEQDFDYGPEDDGEGSATAASSDSPFGSLLAKRREIEKNQVLDIAVPRWEDPEVYVRYRPLDHKVIRSGLGKVEDAKGPNRGEVEVRTNAEFLIRACIEVYAFVDGVEYSLAPGNHYGEKTRFDPELGKALDVREKSAVAVCRALFFTEGDLLNHGAQLAEFSGYSQRKTDREFAGE